MPLALFQLKLSNFSIDKENGILRGVRVMELGKLAVFAGPDGKPKSVAIKQKHIDALMSHAGNRAIPMHLTHDWTSAKEDKDTAEMTARIGALKSFRKDDEGNLIADAYFKEGQIRQDMMWAAEHNPEDNMLSAVFNYAPSDPDCTPTSFKAADLVPQGAATTALFSRINPNENTMDKTAFLEMLKDPDVIAAFAAIVPKPEATATLSSADVEKKISDGVTAALKEFKPILTAEQETALLTKAEASFTKSIGTNPGLRDLVDGRKADDEFEQAVQAQLSNGASDRGIAIRRVAADKPALYNAHMKKVNG